MKRMRSLLPIVALAVAATVITSCGNPTASITGNTAGAAAPAAANSVFSYKIDGKVYAWEGNDPYANQGSIDSKGEVLTSRSDTRIAGTFSGELMNSATEKPAQLTDGKFDLPLKKSNN